MNDAEQAPFGGFEATTRTFYVTVIDPKVQRVWAQSILGDGTPPEFSTYITARAVGTADQVSEIGSDTFTSEFELGIRRADPATERRNRTRARELDDLLNPAPTDDTPEQRLWAHIREEVDKKPETATLYFVEQDWELDVAEGWALECRIPPDAFDSLLADILAARASQMIIGIEWVGGLIRNRYLPLSRMATWGLFKLPHSRSAQPMLGHVSMTR